MRSLIVILILALACTACQNHKQNSSTGDGEYPASSHSGASNGGAADAAGADSSAAPAVQTESAPTGSRDFGALTALDVTLGVGRIDITSGPRAAVAWKVEVVEGANAAPLDSLKLSFEEAAGKLKVAEVYSGDKKLKKPKVTLTVTLPPAAEIKLGMGNGDINVQSEGLLTIDLGNGNLSVRGSSPGSEVTLGNGTLTGEMKIVQGTHDFRVGNGKIAFKFLPGCDLNYIASTGMGPVKLDAIEGTRKKLGAAEDVRGMLGGGRGHAILSMGVGEVDVTGSGEASKPLGNDAGAGGGQVAP